MNLTKYKVMIPASDMATPIGMLYVINPAKLQEINANAMLRDDNKHYHIYRPGWKEAGRILRVYLGMGHLEIDIGVNPRI